MLVKSTAVIELTKKEMYFASGVVEAVFADIGLSPVITSGSDSVHMRQSLHAIGQALDYRTKHIPLLTKDFVIKTIKKILEPLGFDVLLRDAGKDNEHLHIEFQPKGTEVIFIRQTT